FSLGVSSDAAVDHEMRDVDALGPHLARQSLRQAAQRELAHGEGRRLGVALDARRGAGEEKAAALPRQHAFQRGLRDEEAAVGRDHQRPAHLVAIELEERPAHAVARVVDHEGRRVDHREQRLDLRGVGRIAGEGLRAGFLLQLRELVEVARGERDAHAGRRALPRERGGQTRPGADDQRELALGHRMFIMRQFVYVSHPARVVFGAGSAKQLAPEVAQLGAKRVLLISSRGRAEAVKKIARGLPVIDVFDRAVMHTPHDVVEAARMMAKAANADCCVAVGGGSTIGFGKAIALTSGLPVVAVPTTYSGSEMTTIWGVSEGKAKKTGRDPKVLPRVVIYDPQLTLELPPAISAASGVNAMAHCAEALYAHDGNPIVSIMAEEGMRALALSLPTVVRH